jgi:hypothetical protein
MLTRRMLQVCLLVLIAPAAAHAIPAFARKTGIACSGCHEVWPRLNDFGQLYRDNGYRLKQGRDAPVLQDPSYWPIAMRTTVGYQAQRRTQVETDRGVLDTQTGTFGFTGLDVFAAGTLGEKISFLVVYTPSLASAGFQLAPQDGDLESAFVGLHDLAGTSWLNVRVGRHSVDLPEDQHRTITLTQGYNSYFFNPVGSLTGFAPGENQNGIEVYGHSELSRLRYSVSLVNANATPFSSNWLSSPAIWGHLQASHLFDNPLLAEIKGGVFGAYGWAPTGPEALPVGGGPPLAGTAFGMKNFSRYGAELHLYFLSSIYPLTLTGVVLGGGADPELVPGATDTTRFLGGWGEVSYTPTIHLTFIGRYERIRTTSGGAAGVPQDLGNQTIYTGAIRHTFELTNRTEVALHAELSSGNVTSATGQTPTTTTALLALDVAF